MIGYNLMSNPIRHILYSSRVRFSQNYTANSEKVVFPPPQFRIAPLASFLAAAKDDFKRQRTGPGTRVASRSWSSAQRGLRAASGGTRGWYKILILRVSLITHGSLSALRTLGGVPRDRGVLGWAGYRQIAERGNERGDRKKRTRLCQQCVSLCF